MAFCPGNFEHGFAIKLQYRVISWVKRNNAISCCAKRRDYSSSFPVKYIPKKSSDIEENGAASLPVRYLEKRHNGADLNLDRVDFFKNSSSRFLDVNSKNHGACRASDINYGLNLAVEEVIKVDFVALNDEFIEESEKIVDDISEGCSGIQSGHSRQVVEKLAIEFLASRSPTAGAFRAHIHANEEIGHYIHFNAFLGISQPNFLADLEGVNSLMRAFTALELKKKLQAKRFPLDIVDAVITDFQSRGLINDCLYAETYSRSRWSSSSWGPRRIRQALSKKGISEVDTQKAIKLVFESEEGGDHDSRIDMSKLSINQLYVQASKQWQRSRGAPQDTRKSRMIRWLQYRGFNWSVINYVLKKLESENPS